jgi:hypothetical protein
MSTSEPVIYHGPDPDYCGTCYGEARKHGRKVSLTTIYPYAVCGQCEQHLRNGLAGGVATTSTTVSRARR